jgi:hypothetical protein
MRSLFLFPERSVMMMMMMMMMFDAVIVGLTNTRARDLKDGP